VAPPAVPGDRRGIRDALRALGLRPSSRRGQNFLADRGAVARIAAAAGAGPGDLVLEVGPGLGGLTAALAATGAAVAAVEIEPALAGFLRAAFAEEPRVRVVEADALDGRGGLSAPVRGILDGGPPSPGGRVLVAANLPYSVATPLLLSLLRREPPPADLVIMVQREVADRIRAGPGHPAYGPLSVLVRSVARAATVEVVRPASFHPVPAVGSTVIRVTPDPALRRAAGDPAALERAVFAAFGARRKTIANALARAGHDPALLAAAGIDGTLRAEALPPAAFVALAAALPSLAPGRGPGEDARSSP
jgi:16S rRNA (adenine1518-N6/adenine1519-N6)-dimethyltransferase